MTPDTFFSGQQNSKIKHLSKITDEVSFFDVTGGSQMGGGGGSNHEQEKWKWEKKSTLSISTIKTQVQFMLK